jgi:uroporphyrinogen-III synthase
MHPEQPLRVCSFESRRGSEMQSLIERHGAIATIAPSMREVPLDDNPAVFDFARELLEGRIDIVIFMTGVGASALLETLETRYPRAQILAALEKTITVVRGPKPTAILRGWGLRIDHRAPEPNTWHEVLALLTPSVPLDRRRVAVQEYGAPSNEFYEALKSHGATVIPVPVYRWALPRDLEPLRSAVRKTIDGQFDLVLFTSAQQLNHVLAVSEQEGLRDDWLNAVNNRCLVASIGPTATETLLSAGVRVDVEPSHPNMGTLVKESFAAAKKLLAARTNQ